MSIKCLNSDKRAFALINLNARLLIWYFQLRFSSILILQFGEYHIFSINFSISGISVSFLADLNKATFFVLIFRKVLFAFSQFIKFLQILVEFFIIIFSESL